MYMHPEIILKAKNTIYCDVYGKVIIIDKMNTITVIWTMLIKLHIVKLALLRRIPLVLLRVFDIVFMNPIEFSSFYPELRRSQSAGCLFVLFFNSFLQKLSTNLLIFWSLIIFFNPPLLVFLMRFLLGLRFGAWCKLNCEDR